MTTLQTFRFSVPLIRDEELVKGERKRLLKGIASTESRDRHGEEVLLSGMEFTNYLSSGHLNYDHLKGPQYILGKPLEARIVSDGSTLKKGLAGPAFFHLCELYDTEPGRAAWDLLKTEENDPNRNHGFSVEGAILESRGRLLSKTRVDDVALTPTPANTDTFAEFVKSLTAGGTQGVLDMQYIDDNQDPGARINQAVDGFTLTNIRDVLWGDCEHDCYDSSGVFRAGARSALYHLVKCRGHDADEAAALVKALASSGII